ncbi:MAG: GNAT family N-acetyltransferase [Tannerellaceae bacterium]|jgi:predicted GNAT family N-acyltransferase|nr:GNAT family N-acetyltransferase [Tannerellaceae bacterium]
MGHGGENMSRKSNSFGFLKNGWKSAYIALRLIDCTWLFMLNAFVLKFAVRGLKFSVINIFKSICNLAADDKYMSISHSKFPVQESGTGFSYICIMIYTDTKKRQLKKLWKAAFEDDEAFVELYFKRVYRNENAMTLEHKGKIVSSLQLLPYTMNFHNTEIPVAYISGACTAEAERGKGWMQQLMQQSLEEMRRRGVALAALIPAEAGLFSFYGKFGFVKAFEYSFGLYRARRKQSATFGNAYSVRLECGKTDKRVYEYFARRLRMRMICVLHDFKDLSNIIKDMELAGGRLFVVFSEDVHEVCGMAFAMPAKTAAPNSEAVALVKEWFYENSEAGDVLFSHVADYFGVNSVVYRTPCEASQLPQPYGMARVIDVERMIDIWLAAHPESVRRKEELAGMDVRSLTSLLLDYTNRRAYMSLMLD